MVTILSPLVDLWRSSIVFGFLNWLFGPIWTDPLGRTFLLTTFFTYVGLSVYGGYLSRFAGGFGGLSLGHSGVEITDLITLFPTAIVTISRILYDAAKAFIRPLLLNLIYFVLANLIGIVVAGVTSSFWQISPNAANTLLEAGVIIYGAVVFLHLPLATYKPNLANSKWWLPAIYGVLTIAIFLLSLGLLSFAQQGSPDRQVNQTAIELKTPISDSIFLLVERVTPILLELCILLYTILGLFFLPVYLGIRMAQIAVRGNVLSKVNRLILKQPLSSLDEFASDETPQSQQKVPWKQRWFTGSALNVAVKPDVYSYVSIESKSMYLIASFAHSVALYVPSSGEVSANGRLIVIDRELIRSIELQSARL
jgi:hypothetical protein